jgi:threonine aldolase
MSFEPARFDATVPVRVNLSSDTQTLPSRAMKAAMMDAPLGDEQAGADPTVWALCDRVAALLGTEAAMFLPSGTMANQVAIATHCRPGDEVLAHEDAHIITSEGGAAQAIAGVMLSGLPGARGQFDAVTLEAAIRPGGRYSPPQRLVEVEQTANRGGGSCWSAKALRDVTTAAHKHGLSTHMDGARLMNAAVALGVPPSDFARNADSLTFCLSKGLSAPVGSVLLSSAATIAEARRMRKMVGGGMRQAGILAAAGLVALRDGVDRLADDHRRARSLAEGLSDVPGIRIDLESVQSNIVRFDIGGLGITSGQLAEALAKDGVRISGGPSSGVRMVVHRHIDDQSVKETLAAVGRLGR